MRFFPGKASFPGQLSGASQRKEATACLAGWGAHSPTQAARWEIRIQEQDEKPPENPPGGQDSFLAGRSATSLHFVGTAPNLALGGPPRRRGLGSSLEGHKPDQWGQTADWELDRRG